MLHTQNLTMHFRDHANLEWSRA